MTPAEILSPELTEKVDALRAAEKPFAFATIVRTVGSTAAKPGAKALLAEDGTILEGWLGGGCARGAVKRAALTAFRTAEPLKKWLQLLKMHIKRCKYLEHESLMMNTENC